MKTESRRLFGMKWSNETAFCSGSNPVLRKDRFFTGYNSSGYPELSWHGEKSWSLDTAHSFLTFGFLYAEPAADFKTEKDCFIHCAVNGHWEQHDLELPIIPAGMKWQLVLDTGAENRDDECLQDGHVRLIPRSIAVLLAC